MNEILETLHNVALRALDIAKTARSKKIYKWTAEDCAWYRNNILASVGDLERDAALRAARNYLASLPANDRGEFSDLLAAVA